MSIGFPSSPITAGSADVSGGKTASVNKPFAIPGAKLLPGVNKAVFHTLLNQMDGMRHTRSGLEPTFASSAAAQRLTGAPLVPVAPVGQTISSPITGMSPSRPSSTAETKRSKKPANPLARR